MAELYGKKFTKRQLLQRIGNIDQVAGARLCELQDGPEKGVKAIQFRTGTGFSFTVLPDRGMDISSADYCGRSLCWRSATGDVAPAFYDREGLNWLYGFFGGLLTTCGLTYCGAPCEDEGEQLGLHGRISNTPAREVGFGGAWRGDEYVMYAEGKIVEASVFGPCLCMTRRITAELGRSRLFIHDEIENIGYDTVPHMYLQHINLGFPVVDEGARLLIPSLEVIPRDEEAEKGKENYDRFEAPVKGYAEKCYYHVLASNAEGYSCAAIVNPNVDDGFGVYVLFPLSEFTRFNEWKQMGQGVYVVGLEPANCGVEGRAKERSRGTLEFLKPGQKRRYHVEIGVLEGRKAIDSFAASVRKMTGGKRPTFRRND